MIPVKFGTLGLPDFTPILLVNLPELYLSCHPQLPNLPGHNVSVQLCRIHVLCQPPTWWRVPFSSIAYALRAVAKGGRRGRDTPPTKMRCRQINYLSAKCCLLDDFYWNLFKALTPSQNLKHYIIFNW